jgi:hypothetical protein
MQPEKHATREEELAAFVVNSPYENLSPANCSQLKIRIIFAALTTPGWPLSYLDVTDCHFFGLPWLLHIASSWI